MIDSNMTSTGRRLRESNEEILKYINQLRDQRNELGFLVEKQKAEKANLEAEMARITYKVGLINKSLGQRLRALKLYDATLMEIEAKYKGLADSTQGLLSHVKKESTGLESSIDKRIGTEVECKNCPRCDIDVINQLRPQALPGEVPTKQPIEGEKKSSKDSSKGPVIEKESQNVTNNAIYSRTMEYPMVLSPMINKEQMEIIKDDTRSLVAQQPVKNLSNSKVIADLFPRTLSDTTNNKQTEKGISQQSFSASTILEDPDTKPSRECSGSSNKETKSKNNEPEVTPVEISVDDGQTTVMEMQSEVGHAGIEDYDEIIQNVDDRSPKKRTSHPYSNVDVFGQAYKNQHELDQKPQTLARYKKSILNRKENTMFISEDD